MEIFEKRGRFCFYEGAILRKFATKEEVRSDMRNVMDALHRVEDKLDRVLSNN